VAHSESLEAGSYQYFQLLVDHANGWQDLIITVTSFNGDPDLFVSTLVSRPNKTNYELAAQSYLEDSVAVRGPNLKNSTYYIAVYAYSACTFTVVASFSKMIQLQDGRPQSASVEKEAFRLFSFQVAQPRWIAFSLTPVTGSTYLLVSNLSNIDPNSEVPWSTYASFGTQQIVIRDSDPNFSPNCIYYLLVYAYGTILSFKQNFTPIKTCKLYFTSR
jgi:hypothetical protein